MLKVDDFCRCTKYCNIVHSASLSSFFLNTGLSWHEIFITDVLCINFVFLTIILQNVYCYFILISFSEFSKFFLMKLVITPVLQTMYENNIIYESILVSILWDFTFLKIIHFLLSNYIYAWCHPLHFNIGRKYVSL